MSWLERRLSFSELSLPSFSGLSLPNFISWYCLIKRTSLRSANISHYICFSLYRSLTHERYRHSYLCLHIYLYIHTYNEFFSQTNLPGFPCLQWSFKTSRQTISILHQTSIVQAADNTMNGSKRKSLPADSQGRCHLPDVWLSLLLTCLISAPSTESVLILQSRMCTVPIDSKWPLFRLDFYFIWLNDSLSFKPVFMWQIQIMHSTLHFKKRVAVFMKSLLSCNYSYLSLRYTACNWVNTVNEWLVLQLMSYYW